MKSDEYYMSIALALAEEAAADGETPVGAVVVRRDGFIAGRGRNRREKGRNALYHAEILAVDEACRTLGGWRLNGCTLYVTLEPCMMCSGAILSSRLDRVVFGAYDKTGETTLSELAGNRVSVTGGVSEAECSELMKKFFDRLRSERKMSKLNFTEAVTDAQIEAAAALADEIWHEFFPSVLSAEQIDYMVEKFQSARAMKEQMASEGYKYFLLFGGGERVGYTAIKHDSDGRLFLSKLYVKKEHRGKGYATEVFEFLKRYCRENGLSAVWLTVNKHNKIAISVYEKRGFRKIGEGVTDIGNGFVMDDYYFQLDVD
ncbi:MAG: GNAT family N-acetyltransferase [Ruminococcus sp.]|nr:GNAT family N-acetyltransferase [Ruminococcus sp.]